MVRLNLFPGDPLVPLPKLESSDFQTSGRTYQNHSSRSYEPALPILGAILLILSPVAFGLWQVHRANVAYKNIYGINRAFSDPIPSWMKVEDFQQRPAFIDHNGDGLTDLLAHDKKFAYIQQEDGSFVKEELKTSN